MHSMGSLKDKDCLFILFCIGSPACWKITDSQVGLFILQALLLRLDEFNSIRTSQLAVRLYKGFSPKRTEKQLSAIHFNRKLYGVKFAN